MKQLVFLTALTLSIAGGSAYAQNGSHVKLQAQTPMQDQRAAAQNAAQRAAEHAAMQSAKQAAMLKARIEQNVFMAYKQLTAHDYVSAINSYKRALAEDPNNSQAHAGIGMAYAKQFKLDAAEKHLDKAIELDPGNPLAHAAKAMAYLNRTQSSNGEVLSNMNNYMRLAEAEAYAAVHNNNNLPEAHYVLGTVLKERQEFAKAAEQFEIATQIDPRYSEAHAGLGMSKLLAGNPQDSIQHFNEAIRHDSGNSTAHFGLGTAYLKTGKLNEAVNELNIAQYQFPNSAPVHYMLGEAYRSQGNSVAAIKEYQESIRIKPENPGPYLRIADVREARGDLEHAIADLRSAKEALPDNMQVRQRLADLNLKLEKADDAIAEYKAVLAAQPNNAAAKKGLVCAYNVKAQKEVSKAFFSSNGYDGAEQALAEAVKLNPNDFELRLAQTKLRKHAGKLFDADKIGTPQTDGDRLAYAEALIHKGKFRDALKEMNAVIVATKDTKQVLAIGDIALMIHDLESAESAYRKALTMEGGKEKDRAERGLVQVHKVRDEARKDLAVASDLAENKQWQGALTKFYDAIKKDPRDPVARMGVAKVLDHVDEPTVEELRESINQYRAYMELEPAMPNSERSRIERHIAKLQHLIAKTEARHAAIAAKRAEREKSDQKL
jgi:tetratricopeptide (TPR) repeat protein